MGGTMLARYWEKVDPSGGEFACWPWQASRNRDGYGKFALGRESLAHRVAHEQIIGPIPAGWDVHHRCGNRGCQNPHHLEALPRRRHLRCPDHPAALRRAKTHCPAGHRYSQANTYRSRGRRWCRTCRKEANRRRRRARGGR